MLLEFGFCWLRLLFRRPRLCAAPGILQQAVCLGKGHDSGFVSQPGPSWPTDSGHGDDPPRTRCLHRTCPGEPDQPGSSSRAEQPDSSRPGPEGIGGKFPRATLSSAPTGSVCIVAEGGALWEPPVPKETWPAKMIQAILVFNNHGKPRLVRFYQHFVSAAQLGHVSSGEPRPRPSLGALRRTRAPPADRLGLLHRA